MKKRTITPRTRTCLITLGALLILAALVAIGRTTGGPSLLTAEAAATTEERVAFLRECGWETDAGSEQEQLIHIPETFSDVYERYNDLQRQQGFDLSAYRGLDCTLYTYAVTNYPDETQTVLADLYIYKNRVIGGDVHSTSMNGFMVGLR